MEGKAQSVCGLLDLSDLGKTLCHEHLYINAEALHVQPNDKFKDNSIKSLTDIENQYWLRYYPYSHKDNLHIERDNILEKELLYYKQSGGKTIVDVTITGLRPNIDNYTDKLVQLSKKTQINIICGTGFYVDHVHPDFVSSSSINDLVDFMTKEIKEGINNTNICAGVIGEIGCSYPLTDNEKKVLQASAIAQQKTGAPLIIHPGRHEDAPIEIVNILKNAGGCIKHTVMSHLDRTLFQDNKWDELAKTGIYLELDLFGIECSYYQHANYYMPHDGQRIDRILYLINKGYEKQILLSHDIHTNHRLIQYGGHGYSHIFNRIIPRLQDKNISNKIIEQIIEINRKKWLQFYKIE